jgi:hypothetical protein
MDHEQSRQDQEVQITGLREPLDDRVLQRLQEELRSCSQVAFAHLTEVRVPAQDSSSARTVFVWLRAEAMRSMRAALNLVSGAVARALPSETFLDVVILNSAPELLEQIEAAGLLLVENDVEERQTALRALHVAEPAPPPLPPRSRPWWWPF